MKTFINKLSLIIVGFVSLAGTQGFGENGALRLTRESLGSYQSRVECHEVNPLPPIDGLTGPLYRGWYYTDFTVDGQPYVLAYHATDNADLTWTNPATKAARYYYRSCEKAKAAARRLDEVHFGYLRLFQKIKNADIEIKIENTTPPVTYCRVSEADVYLFPGTNSTSQIDEVFKMVACPGGVQP